MANKVFAGFLLLCVVVLGCLHSSCAEESASPVAATGGAAGGIAVNSAPLVRINSAQLCFIQEVAWRFQKPASECHYTGAIWACGPYATQWAEIIPQTGPIRAGQWAADVYYCTPGEPCYWFYSDACDGSCNCWGIPRQH
jgi:hypothetical protein